LEKIDFLEFLLEANPEKVNNPVGWLRRAIEENYAPPSGYQPRAAREADAAAAVRWREQAEQEDTQRMAQREVHRRAVLEEYTPSEGLQQLWEKVLIQIRGRSASTYQAYLFDSELLVADGQQVKVWVKDSRTADFLTGQNYTVMIARLVAKEINQPFNQITVEFLYPSGDS
jgi:hypothetical protein